MNSTDFTYWLQGFVELSESDAVPNEKQWLMIKDHLKLVFDKKTPDRTDFIPSRSVEDIIKDAFNKPVDSSYWKLGDPALTITC